MTSSPPSKKFRQATIWEGFKRQRSVTSVTGTGAGSAEAAAASADLGGATRKRKKSQEENDLEDEDEDMASKNCTEEELQQREEQRKKRLAAIEKRLKLSEDDHDDHTKKTEPSKPDSLPIPKKNSPLKAGSSSPGATASASNTPVTPGGAEVQPVSPTQEYDSDFDNSAPLFDSDPDSPELAELSNLVLNSAENSGLTLGTDKNRLNSSPHCLPPLPPLKSTSTHQVLVQVPLVKGELPRPFPHTLRDRWDNDHVKMPYSKENLYPVDGKDGRKELKNRWELIQLALKKEFSSSLDLEEAILTYNTRYAQKWDFRGLHTFFTEVLDRSEAAEFFKSVLPKMVDLALRLPYLCTQPPRLLKQQEGQAVTLSQEQAACLLANAFFCTYPRRNARGRQSEYATYPDINFNQLFVGSKTGASKKAAKLKCIMNYFRRVTTEMPKGTITMRRQHLRSQPAWHQSRKKLTALHVTSQGTIEDDGLGMLQVDFANKFLGGGVLGQGCVQEEIRFLICPELILSRLVTQVLDYNECLIMTGCEQFSKYTGYAASFEWAGNHVDTTPRDDWGRRCVEVVAIDALVIRNQSEQFKPHRVRRELEKAYCGFYCPDVPRQSLPAVATGNWGCGAFGGDLRLKALLQMMAAAEAGRGVAYFTFNDTRLARDIHRMHALMTEKDLTVGDLWTLLRKYNTDVLGKGGAPRTSLYEYMFNALNGYDEVTDEEMMNCDQEDQTKPPPSPDWAADTP